jgi:hypothetical protein
LGRREPGVRDTPGGRRPRPADARALLARRPAGPARPAPRAARLAT